MVSDTCPFIEQFMGLCTGLSGLQLDFLCWNDCVATSSWALSSALLLVRD